MEFIKSLRIQEPLLFFAVLWLCLFGILFIYQRKGFSLARRDPSGTLRKIGRLTKFINVLLLILIANYVLLVLAYVFSNTFFDHAEANVASVSWLFKNNHELYPELNSTERYINYYGPVLYIVNAFFLQLLGPSFFSIKLGCCLAAILSLICIFFGLRAVCSVRIALFGCAYAALAFLSITASFAFQASSFWLRPDPLLIFFMSLSLLSVLRGDRITATLITALALGCSINLKINAFIPFLPVYVILFSRFGLSYTLMSVGGAIGIAFLPFVVFPQISLGNFAIWLSQAGRKPSSLEQLFQVFKWLLYVSMPVTLSLAFIYSTSRTSFHHFIKANRYFIYALLFSLGANLIFSIKVGVLENNHLPFIPLFSYILALSVEWISQEGILFQSETRLSSIRVAVISAIVAFLITFPLAIVLEEARLVSSIIKSPGTSIISDISNIMRTYPNVPMHMGFSEGKGNYEHTYYRPILVFAGNPYLIDVVSMFEMQEANLNPLPDKTINALQSCQVKLWLLPKPTHEPFDLANFYPPHQPVFNEQFKKAFLKVYEKTSESDFFELWSCRGRKQ